MARVRPPANTSEEVETIIFPPPSRPIPPSEPVAEPAPTESITRVEEPTTPALPPTPPTPEPTPEVTKTPSLEAHTPEAPSPPDQPHIVKRALPVETEAPRTLAEYAEWQIQLERHHFSCGTIDGEWGKRSRRAVRQFQLHYDLKPNGKLDDATRLRLGKVGDPYLIYEVTAEDMNQVQPTPELWKEKAALDFLGYNDTWEMVSEKFHTTPQFLQKLNPRVRQIRKGTKLRAPNLSYARALPKAAYVRIILSETTLLAYDQNNRVIACFPTSIARDKNKRPAGELRVINFAKNPNYTFNPKVLTSVAEAEGIEKKIIIPPGPNNPVGRAWIGLSLPGYGIHGTPEPTYISTTGSSGCFRLANWNALKMLSMVSRDMEVQVEP